MQSLFVLETNEYFTVQAAQKQIEKSIDQYFALYHYILFSALEIANFVQKDAEIKASKFLPTEQDREVNAKLLENQVKIQLEENLLFDKEVDRRKFHSQKDIHVTQTLYKKLIESDLYKKYISNSFTDFADDFVIFKSIVFDILLPSEIFVEHLKDLYINLDDDGLDVERLLVKRFGKLKKKRNADILVFSKNEKLTELENFAKTLLQTNVKKKEYLQGEFSEYLINWDANRLARVDRILLQMALSEMLFFSDIPLKVSMNEYIDISKEYSTPKSKELINGVLDKMMKNYTQKGTIVKTGRGLIN